MKKLMKLGLAFSFGLGAIALSPAPQAMATETNRAAVAEVVEVCDGETLNTTGSSGAPLDAVELDAATQLVENFCDYKNVIQPFVPTYGDYVRNDTRAVLTPCSCGPTYQSWSIDVNAVGVPYGSNTLGLIYRVQPDTGGGTAWQMSGSLPITTGGAIPTRAGTMSMGDVIQSYGSLYINGNLADDVYNVAGAA